MKLSVWSSYYCQLSPEDALRELRAHGYKHCELSDEHALAILERGDTRKVGAEYGKFARDIGMDLLQGHLFLRAKIGIPEDRELLMRQFELFEAIGVKNAVLHCDNLDYIGEDVSLELKREKNTEALRLLCDAIKDTDITVCIENLRYQHFTKTADDLLYFINEINSKHLGICLDTGHLNLSPEPNQLEFIAKAGKYIKALHLADNDGSGDQHLMPFARGTVDMVSVIREMKKIGYEGLYNLEIPGERTAPMEILGYKLDYIKKTFDYIDKITN